MKNYIIYEPGSGRIASMGHAQDAAVDALVPRVGYAKMLIEVTVNPDTHYVLNGAIMEMPEQPSLIHVFDYATKQWKDPRTLADMKVAKNAEINSARLAANRGTFAFMGKQISCDELSRSDIDGMNGLVSLLGTMPANWLGYWKAADNSYVAIPDVATWGAFYGAMVAQGQTNFEHSQSLKTQLNSANTLAAVEAITW